MIRSQNNLGTNNLKTLSISFSIGLLFENFEISYKILNADYQYENFETPFTDIKLPIYQMNYISVKWEFEDN